MTGSRTRRYAPPLSLLLGVCQRSSTPILIIAGTWSLRRDQITTTWEKYSRISCTREVMITTTNMIGCLKSQDNKSILKITLTPNLLLPEFKVSWRSLPNLDHQEIQTISSKNSSRKERKIELCSGNRWWMVLNRDKSPRLRERLNNRATEETHRLLDGPTASFLWPCSNKSRSKIPQVMELMAEVPPLDKFPKEIGELRLDNPSDNQVEVTSPSHNLKLRL